MVTFKIPEGFHGTCSRCMDVELWDGQNSNKVLEEFSPDPEVDKRWSELGLGDPPTGVWVHVCDSCLKEEDIIDEVTE